MTAQSPTIVITGATNGLGALAAASLADMGARLILVARSAERAQQTITSLRESSPVEAEVVLADLSRPADVRRAGEEIRSRHERIDVLVNNAGLHAFEPRLTDDGLPEMVAVNYLAPFVLTRELLPSLLRSPAGRVVNVASEASRRHGDLRIRRSSRTRPRSRRADPRSATARASSSTSCSPWPSPVASPARP